MNNNSNIGFFRLVDKRDNKILKRYDYNKISAKERKELKQELEKKPYLGIYCDCTSDNIELKIASNLVIYNYQRNIGERHNPNCPKYKDTDLISWTYSQKERAYKAGSYNTAQDYIVKLNSFIFQEKINSLNDTFKYINREAFRIITDKDVKLNWIINPEKIKPNTDYFAYGYLGKMVRGEGRFKDYIIITCIIDKDPNLKTIDILADINTFNIYYSENRYYTLLENRKPLLIGGWFNYDNELNKNIFTDFWMKAVDNTGKIF
jgi:hypothetical protein